MKKNLIMKFVDPGETYGPHKIERMLRTAAPFETVVDIGAGWGRDLELARTVCGGGDLFALECDQAKIEALKGLGYITHKVNIEEERLPLTDESADVVIANQVLEHIKEIFWIFHEVARILKIGGVFIIGVPNIASLTSRIRLLFGFHPTQARMYSAHVRCFSKNDFESFLRKCWPGGFRLEKFTGSQFYPFPRSIARPLSGAFPTLAQVIFFMFRKTAAYDGQFLGASREMESNYRVGPVEESL